MKTLSFWKLPVWEGKLPIAGSWMAVAGFDLRGWAVGFWFEDHPWRFGANIGPLFFGAEKYNSLAAYHYDELWNWSRTLYRLTIQRWKLELRLDLDLNIWRIGYMMADKHDHGLYFGPFNIQIEYDKFYDWPDMNTPPPRVECDCDRRI